VFALAEEHRKEARWMIRNSLNLENGDRAKRLDLELKEQRKSLKNGEMA
jgi:hypothetical protein